MSRGEHEKHHCRKIIVQGPRGLPGPPGEAGPPGQGLVGLGESYWLSSNSSGDVVANDSVSFPVTVSTTDANISYSTSVIKLLKGPVTDLLYGTLAIQNTSSSTSSSLTTANFTCADFSSYTVTVVPTSFVLQQTSSGPYLQSPSYALVNVSATQWNVPWAGVSIPANSTYTFYISATLPKF